MTCISLFSGCGGLELGLRRCAPSEVFLKIRCEISVAVGLRCGNLASSANKDEYFLADVKTLPRSHLRVFCSHGDCAHSGNQPDQATRLNAPDVSHSITDSSKP